MHCDKSSFELVNSLKQSWGLPGVCGLYFEDCWLRYVDFFILEVYRHDVILTTTKNKPKYSSTFGSQKWTLWSQGNAVHHHLNCQVHLVDCSAIWTMGRKNMLNTAHRASQIWTIKAWQHQFCSSKTVKNPY